MITPFDIEKKEFSVGVRGYNKDEVDDFLDIIIVDLEKIIKENLRLKAELAAYEQEKTKAENTEGEVIEVLEKARSLMDDISKSAEKRADVLLKNAELDAEIIVKEAKQRSESLREENMILEKRYVSFRDKYLKMLKDELDRFENMTDDMFPMNDSKLEEIVNGSMAEPETFSTVNFDEEAAMNGKTQILPKDFLKE